MKIGVISDTHDNLSAIRYFVDWFNSQSADLMLHAGDFVSPFTIPELIKFDGPIHGVFGNNDGDRETLQSKIENTNMSIKSSPRRIQVNNFKCIMAHKPDQLPDSNPNSGDLIIHGHTHERKIKEGGNGEYHVNPGEAGGWLRGTCSALLLHTRSMEFEIEVIPKP